MFVFSFTLFVCFLLDPEKHTLHLLLFYFFLSYIQSKGKYYPLIIVECIAPLFVVCEQISAVYGLELQCFSGYIDIQYLSYIIHLQSMLFALWLLIKSHGLVFQYIALHISCSGNVAWLLLASFAENYTERG